MLFFIDYFKWSGKLLVMKILKLSRNSVITNKKNVKNSTMEKANLFLIISK